MLIKDIRFRRIRKLAKKRLWENEARWSTGGEALGDFEWRATPEHYDFWESVSECNYEEAYKLRPDLFRPTKKEIKEAYKMHEIFLTNEFMKGQPA